MKQACIELDRALEKMKRNHFLEYLGKMIEVEGSVRLTAFYTRETAEACRMGSVEAKLCALHVKRLNKNNTAARAGLYKTLFSRLLSIDEVRKREDRKKAGVAA